MNNQHCPICGSDKIHFESDGKEKYYECEDCTHTWEDTDVD